MSQQLSEEAADIWAKVSRITDTVAGKKDLPDLEQEREAFWNGAEDDTKHNKKASLAFHLRHLESFYDKVGQPSPEGKFTATGHTIGECRLWVVLHVIVDHIKSESVLDAFPNLAAFYQAILATPECQGLLKDGGKGMPKAFRPYFVLHREDNP